MRKLFFSMMTAIFLIANCQRVGAQLYLLNENFDNITSGVPAGWDDSDHDCYEFYCWKSGARGYGGTRGLSFNAAYAPKYTHSAVKTPVLNLNQEYVLRFKYKNYNAGQLDVYISLDGGDTYSILLDQGLSTPDNDTWQDAEYSLAQYIGQSDVCIVFKGISNYGDYHQYLDDVSVESVPTCFVPGNITVGAVSPNNDVTLSWSAGPSAETSWVLAYELKVGNIVVAFDSLTVTSPNYTFTNLSFSASYNLSARVYAVCSPTDMSEPKKFNGSFSTLCGVITSFPYVQDFEGSTVPPNCWSQQVVDSSTIGGKTNAWQSSSIYKHSGTHSAYIPDQQAGAKTALTTGKLNFTDPNGYQVSFWMYRQNTYYQSKVDEAIHIYVSSSDSLDVTTAIELGAVNADYHNAPAEAVAGWYQYTFDVPASVTGSQYVSFCYHNQYGSGTYIDDVMIRPTPICRDMATPQIVDIQPNLAIVMINDTSAHTWDISYGPQGTAAGAGTIITVTDTNAYTLTGLTPNTAYDVYIRCNCGTEFGAWTLTPVSFTAICSPATATVTDAGAYNVTLLVNTNEWELSWGPQGTTAAAGTIIPVSGTNTYTVTGLTPATNYVFYVRHTCADTYSDWSSAINAKTTIVPDSIPFQTDFEDATDNSRWTIVDGSDLTNHFVFGTDANAVASGSQALYIANNTSGAYGYDTGKSTKTFAYRTIYFGSGVHNVTFKFKCTGGESAWDFASVMLVPASETLAGGSGKSNVSSTTWPNFAEVFSPVENQKHFNLIPGEVDGWTTYSRDIDMTGREGTYNFAVLWSNDGTGGASNYPISIDNLSITRISCNTPTVHSCSTTSTSTTITVGTQTASEWEIAVSSTPIDMYGSVTGDIYQQVSSGPAVLTGLTANTVYYYTARAVCGAGDTSKWADVQIVRTHCKIPYEENFELMTANTVPDGWDNSASTSTTVTLFPDFIWGVYAQGGNQMIRMDNYHVQSGLATINTPVIEFDAIGATLNFDLCHQASSGDMEVLISTDGGASWTSLATYAKTNNSTDRDIPQDWVNEQIDLAAYANQNVIIRFSNNANYDEGAIFIDNVMVRTTLACATPTDLTTVAVATAHEVQLDWTAGGTETEWLVCLHNAAGTTYQTVTEHPCTLSGLNASSSYSISVAAICGVGDTSYFTVPVEVTTTCDVVSTPYEENFELMTVNTVPLCWDNSASTSSTLSSNPQYLWGVYAQGGNQMIRMNNFLVQNGLATINTPVIVVGATGATLNFDLCHQASSGDMEVLVSTDGGASWTSLATYAMTNTSTDRDIPQDWVNEQIDLTAYANRNVIIRFSNNANYDMGAIFIDNVMVRANIACATPTDLISVAAATAHEVQLDWTAGGTETEWQVCIQNTFGTTYQTVTAHPCTVSGLNAASNYNISVAAICGVDDTSYFTAPIAVTTACGVVVAPVNETFQLMPASAVPSCWDNSASTSLTLSSNPQHIWGVYNASGNKMLRMCNYLVQSGDAVIETPSYDLSNGVNSLTLSFDYCHQATCGAFNVEITNDNGLNWTTIGSYSSNSPRINHTEPDTWTAVTYPLNNFIGDTVRFRFYAVANYGSGAIFIDNFLIDAMSTSGTKDITITVDSVTYIISESLQGDDDVTIKKVIFDEDNLMKADFDISYAPSEGATPGLNDFINYKHKLDIHTTLIDIINGRYKVAAIKADAFDDIMLTDAVRVNIPAEMYIIGSCSNNKIVMKISDNKILYNGNSYSASKAYKVNLCDGATLDQRPFGDGQPLKMCCFSSAGTEMEIGNTNVFKAERAAQLKYEEGAWSVQSPIPGLFEATLNEDEATIDVGRRNTIRVAKDAQYNGTFDLTFCDELKFQMDNVNRSYPDCQFTDNIPLGNGTEIKAEMKFNNKEYYHFSLPFDCYEFKVMADDAEVVRSATMNDAIYSENTAAHHYVLFRWDESAYKNDTTSGYVGFSGTKFERNKGYVIAIVESADWCEANKNNPDTSLDVTAIFVANDDYTEIASSENEVVIPVTRDDAANPFSGWNLVGNPFYGKVKSSQYSFNKYVRKVVSDNGENADIRDYASAIPVFDEPVRPFETVFIHKSDAAGEGTVSVFGTSPEQDVQGTPAILPEYVTVTLNDSSRMMDRTTIISNVFSSDDYLQEEDLMKSHQGSNEIYTQYGDFDFSFNEMNISEGEKVIPLAVKVAAEGNYTIAMSSELSNYNIGEVQLHDKTLETFTRLSDGESKTLHLIEGVTEDRLELVIKVDTVITITDNIGDETGSIDVYVHDGTITLEGIEDGSTVTIVDATGKTLFASKTTGYRMDYQFAVRGVYMITVRNSESVNTVKVVY